MSSSVLTWFLPFTKKYGLTEERIRNNPHHAGVKISSFFDIHGPWVLVPQGSLFHFFDWVPLHLRIGPWNICALPTIILVMVMTFYYRPTSSTISSSTTSTTTCYYCYHYYTYSYSYAPLDSYYFYYNLFAFLYMTVFLVWVMTCHAKGLIVTFTMISWTLNAMRHGLNALGSIVVRGVGAQVATSSTSSISPSCCNDDWWLVVCSWLHNINQVIRFPALASASVVFCLWNVILAPGIYYYYTKHHHHQQHQQQQKDEDPTSTNKSRTSELFQFNFSYRMVQVHMCNILYSFTGTLVVVVSEPAGGFHHGSSNNNHTWGHHQTTMLVLFSHKDFWYGLTFGIGYGLFYILVLDRLGVHLYPVFSPRYKYFALIWICQIGFYKACHWFWNAVLLQLYNYEPMLMTPHHHDSRIVLVLVMTSVFCMIFPTVYHSLKSYCK